MVFESSGATSRCRTPKPYSEAAEERKETNKAASNISGLLGITDSQVNDFDMQNKLFLIYYPNYRLTFIGFILHIYG